MLVPRDIEWSKSRMPHLRTFRNLTHWAWPIWDISNHDMFRIIPDPGSQQRVSLSLESICTIPFQARASDVLCWRWDSTVPAAECHASSMSLAPVRGNGITQTRIQVPFSGFGRISFGILPIPSYSGQAWWAPEKFVMWVLSGAHMTGTIVTPAGSWSNISHHQSPMYITH